MSVRCQGGRVSRPHHQGRWGAARSEKPQGHRRLRPTLIGQGHTRLPGDGGLLQGLRAGRHQSGRAPQEADEERTAMAMGEGTGHCLPNPQGHHEGGSQGASVRPSGSDNTDHGCIRCGRWGNAESDTERQGSAHRLCILNADPGSKELQCLRKGGLGGGLGL